MFKQMYVQASNLNFWAKPTFSC